MLTIFETLMILVLDDDEGEVLENYQKSIEYVVTGAVLAELFMMKRITLTDHRVDVVDHTPTGHAIMNKALTDILDASRNRKPKYWINTLAYEKYQEEICQNMVNKGFLVRKKKKLHLGIPKGKNSEATQSVKFDLKHRLREIVLTGQKPEQDEIVLLAFIYHSLMLKLVFTHDEHKTAHKLVKKMLISEDSEYYPGDALNDIITTACEMIT